MKKLNANMHTHYVHSRSISIDIIMFITIPVPISLLYECSSPNISPIRAYGHKTVEHGFVLVFEKAANQNSALNEYYIFIGQFFSTNSKGVLKSFKPRT